MKKILYLYHASSIGGGSYCLLNILKGIDRNSFHPMVLLKNEGPLVDEIRNLDIEVFTLSSITQVPYNRPLFKFSSIKSYINIHRSLSDFANWLKNKDIDIVYINTMMLYPYLKVAKQLGKKTIIHIRECWPENEHKNQLKWAQNEIEKYADHVVAINQCSASIIPAVKGKMTIVYDWIDFTDRYKYMPFDEIFDEDCSQLKVYLFTGGMQKIKGAYEVVKTFVNHIKDANSRLLFMGYDMPKYVSLKYRIKVLLSKIGVISYELKVRNLIEQDKRITCIKGCYEIKHIFEQSYCMLSYYTIPHANLALAESIILGTPVIAASTNEALEYSNNGTLAYLFKINDIESFISAIENFSLFRDEEVKKLRISSQNIKKLFDRERNIKLLHNVYKKVLNS